MRTRQVLRGAVVRPDAVLPDGAVLIEDSVIRWVGPTGEAPVAVPGPTDDVLLPGLVDLHCHGGAGVGFPDAADAVTAGRAVHEHLRHGTTSLVASLVAAPAAELLARALVLAELCGRGDLAGIHVEGPFLAPTRCGAQDPAHLVRADVALVHALAEAAQGHLVTMTVAPDVPGVTGPGGVLEALVHVGAVPSLGHTDASAELAEQALAAARQLLQARTPGARPTVTHLFNGMPPLHHREPGPVAACLAAAARGEAVVELVADGVHLAPATVRSVLAVAAPDAVVLVTDATAAAGMPDGSYRLGSRPVRVRDGVARLTRDDGEDGALAGGTTHLLDVVRRTVEAGVPLARAVRAASSTPATVLGRTDVGALEAGRRADVVVCDRALAPRRVLRAGVTV